MFHKYNGSLHRGTQRRFPPKSTETENFLGYPEYCILCRAMKICVSFRSSCGNLSLFEITRASVLFFRKFQRQFNALTEMRIFLIPLSIIFSNPKVLGFLFSTKNSLTQEVKCEKINFKKTVGNLLDKLRKLCTMMMNATFTYKFLAVLK